MLTLQQRSRSEVHNIFTDKNDKVTLTANYYKRLQALDGITSYPHSTDNGRLCKIVENSGPLTQNINIQTSTLLNPINYQPNIDKIYFHANDAYEAKY